MGAKYFSRLWTGFILTIDNNKKPKRHDESGKNSEDRQTIFQPRLDRVIEKTWRKEIGIGRVYGGMANNQLGSWRTFQV